MVLPKDAIFRQIFFHVNCTHIQNKLKNTVSQVWHHIVVRYSTTSLLPWRWRQYVPLKHRWISTRPCGLTSKMTAFFIQPPWEPPVVPKQGVFMMTVIVNVYSHGIPTDQCYHFYSWSRIVIMRCTKRLPSESVCIRAILTHARNEQTVGVDLFILHENVTVKQQPDANRNGES